MPITLMRLIVKFVPLFSQRVGEHVEVGVGGALLAPGKRPVTAVLRVMGVSQEGQFQQYPRVLNRARWSSVAVARVLLGLVVDTFVFAGPVIMGIDAAWERRRGAKIKAKGIYRDPVRSARSHMVKASGLRWRGARVVAERPWAGRVWAVPFLTARCPWERHHQQRGRRHKTLPEGAGQVLGLCHRWLPGREVVVVAESAAAVSELLQQVSAPSDVSLSTRLRVDAALYDPAPPRVPGQNGRPRKKGARRPPPAARAAGSSHAVAPPDGEQRVWGRRTCGGNLHGYGRVVSPRLATSRRARGGNSGPPGRVRAPSPALPPTRVHADPDRGGVRAALDQGSDL